MFGCFEEFYVNQIIKSKREEENKINSIDLELCSSLNELESVEENKINLNFKNKKKIYKLHIRSKAGATTNSINGRCNHNVSLKIVDQTLVKGTNDISIPIPPNNGNSNDVEDKIKPDQSKERIKSVYSEVIDFVYNNRETLNAIWNCKDENEFNELINKLIDDNKNLNKKK